MFRYQYRNIIVITYVQGGKPYYVKVTGPDDGKYTEVQDPTEATTFDKKKNAVKWIEDNNVLRREFMKVEALVHHLKPLKT